jgi:hypothetical protein
MKTLFELADFYANKSDKQGVIASPQATLHTAAMKATEGYRDLKEAEAEDLTRYDGFGNEIPPQVVHEAVRYLRALPNWIDAQLQAAAIRIDEQNGEKIDRLPDMASWDRHAARLESEAMEKRQALHRASVIYASQFAPQN